MSTILDALKKVERERESPSDRLRHEPDPAPPRSRRVSTATIVVCAVLGFGVGAGIALWRNAAPSTPETAAPIETTPPRVAVPAVPDREEAPTRVASSRLAAPPAAGTDASGNDSALEPSPFTPPRGAAADGPGDDGPAARPAVPAVPVDPGVAAGPRDLAPGEIVVSGAPGPAPEVLAAVPADPAAGDAPEPRVLGNQEVFDAPEPDVLGDQDIADEEPAEPAEAVIDTGRSPPGAPQVTLSFLQWSSDPARRFAFVSVDGGPSQRIREGDSAGGASVDRITPDGVRLRHADTLFVIRPRH